LWTFSQLLILQHHIHRPSISVTEEDSPALFFQRWAATAQFLGVLVYFRRRSRDEMAGLSKEIHKYLLLMNSKAHLSKRNLKQGTNLEKSGLFCALFCTMFLKMSNSTKSATQSLVITTC